MKKRKKGAASDRGFNSVMMVWLCVTLFILLFPIFAIIHVLQHLQIRCAAL